MAWIWAGLLAAFGGAELVCVDSAGDQLVRFVDEDGDGRFWGVHEVTVLWRSATALTPRAAAFEATAAGVRVHWVDSTRDRFRWAGDVDGNGALEAFEERLFRDSKVLDGASRPLDAVWSEDALWWCSDDGVAGLFALRDRDGDGDASGAGERAVFLGDGPSHPIEVEGATEGFIGTRDVLGLAPAGDGVVAWCAGADELLVRVVDANDDGDARDPGEAKLFLEPTGKRADLPQAEAWRTGGMRNLRVAPNGGFQAYGRLSELARARQDGEEVWYLACDSNAAGPFGTNVFQQGLNGLVFRGRDLNGDGDLQDVGEVGLYYDGSWTSSASLGFQKVIGMDALDGVVWVAYLDGAAKRIARLEDRDGDGNAMGSADDVRVVFDSDEWAGRAPFEAGAPFIRDLVARPGGELAPPNGLFRSTGRGCAPGLFETGTTLHGIGRARLGSRSFTCQVRGAPPGHLAVLLIGEEQEVWFASALPLDLTGGGLPGCTLYGPIHGWVATVPKSVGGESVGSYTFDVPDWPDLLGRTYVLQWLTLDPDSATLFGLRMSQGGVITVEE